MRRAFTVVILALVMVVGLFTFPQLAASANAASSQTIAANCKAPYKAFGLRGSGQKLVINQKTKKPEASNPANMGTPVGETFTKFRQELGSDKIVGEAILYEASPL